MKNLIILTLGFFISCDLDREVPQVVTVFPSSDTLPENTLRMYLQFSEPMKTINNLEKIKLLDQNGQEVKGAIFNNVYELWDPSQTQLTLIFDPARVKTGLRANERLGRALKPGLSYRLKIEDLETIHHQKITPYEREFYVDLADSTRPNTRNWKVQTPDAGTSAPLKVSLAETADWMSLNHSIMVIDEGENQIEGTIEIGRNEKDWFFTPKKKWKLGTYLVVINARFADPSGNNLNGLFDHPEGALRFKSEDEVVKIPFSILGNE